MQTFLSSNVFAIKTMSFSMDHAYYYALSAAIDNLEMESVIAMLGI
jgi:hypothetical protein